jgi:phosphoribosyl-ATP pyrophosphohydrolase
MDVDPIRELMDTIHHRKQNPSTESYTNRLLTQGLSAILDKIREESAELVEAVEETASPAADRHVIHEAADLLYHMLVMLSFRGLDWRDVEQEILRRSGTSGLAEKAARKSSKQSGDQ